MPPDSERSPHILNTSSNLLGICFIILTSLKVLRAAEKTIIDEITIIASILFMTSCILSFLSMRKANGRGRKWERAADVAFIGGLSLLFITVVLFSLNIIA
jgi:hypothetical protein